MLNELKQSEKIVGLKQSLRLIESGNAKKAFLAKDCSSHIFDEVEHFCKKYKVPVEYAETTTELGRACGIDVGAAVAVLKKVNDA